ncbi:MAG TPA: type II toxin-antitoxin system VapC family toxin [Galbitalea sp.]
MIAYFDTSMFVPLLIDEATTQECGSLWMRASSKVATRLVHVEASSALERARRAGRVSRQQHDAAAARVEYYWQEIRVLEVDDLLMRRASELASRFGLRSYDAVHCAAAESINDGDLVAASADAQLLDAWHTLGLNTFSGASSSNE